MNDFQGLLSGDYGFKPQGKSAPMAPLRSNPSTNSPFDFDLAGSSSTSAKKAPYSKSPASSVFLDDQDDFFSRSTNSATSKKNHDFGNLGGLDDVFGGGSKSPANSSVNLDSVFSGPADSGARFSSLPVFDKPVYDDDVFEGVSGLKNSSSAKYEDVFSSFSSPSLKKHDAFDDILDSFARKEPESKGLHGSGRKSGNNAPSFDDLLPGFGASTSPSDSNHAESSWDKRSTVNGATKGTSGVDDPFVGLNSNLSDATSSQGLYNTDPLEQFAELGGSSRKKSENVSASGGLFDDIDPFVGLGKSVPMNDREKVESPASTGTTLSSEQTSVSVEANDRSSSVRSPASGSEKKLATEDYYESPGFDTFMASEESHRSAPNTSSSSFVSATDETSSKRHTSTVYESNLDSVDDVWLTVSEIPLFTQPTAAPPPSRPPPPKPPRRAGSGSHPPPYGKKKIDDHPSFPNSAQYFQTPQSAPAGGKSSFTSPVDEFEDFANGRSWNDSDGNSDAVSGDDLDRHPDAAVSADAVSAAVASAAAMKEAMDRAEARFKHAKEVRERENVKAARMQQKREDKTVPDFQERDFRELQERQERERQRREEEVKKQREEEKLQKEREEREREQRRIERERIERERARQAVERATREARERAAADARARAEKAAVGKVQAEARERAERAAVMKAQAEARERAARAAVEAKKRADREKAEKEAQEKEAREKAAAASARATQPTNENDLESIFGMGSRANSAPKARASSSDPLFDSQFPKKPSGPVRTSVGTSPTMRKTSSANIVDDLSSIFGGAPSAGDFHEVDGETEDRRRARLERHQRTQERAAKALAEKNKRDLDAQKEQAERHRISETLDVEIKRWATGKEGNLRALLSTMQYVLWPECGWQPVSLTDLIPAAAVKKAYRKATLCIHPDKVQQKGANLQQKYIAEKVFDLLKEAWNKFNSEELF